MFLNDVDYTDNSFSHESAKQIGMGAGAFQAQMIRRSGINQNPIGLDVEITGSRKFSMKWMILVGRW
jgi:hypothetical protein